MCRSLQNASGPLIQTHATGLGCNQRGAMHLWSDPKHHLAAGWFEGFFTVFFAVCHVEINRVVKVLRQLRNGLPLKADG